MREVEPALSFSFFSGEELETPEWGAQLLRALEGTGLWPERFGLREPLRERTAHVSLPDLSRRWPFFWKGKQGAGAYFVKPPGGLASVVMNLKSSVSLIEAERLFRSAVAAVRPEYAVAVIFTADEIERGRHNRTITMNGPFDGPKLEPVLTLGWPVHLSQGLPTVYWLNAFGPRYIDMIGRARLLSAPNENMVADANLIVLKAWEPLRMGESECNVRRANIITHLGRQFFMPSATVGSNS